MVHDVSDLRASIRSLHDEFAGPLFLFAVRALGDRQLAEEVVQDALLRAWRHADRYDADKGTPAAWLFGITRNLIIDRRRQLASRARADAASAAVPDDGTRELDRALDAWQIASALAHLTPEHRQVIVETYYRGHSIPDTARLVGIPQGTVKSRLYYGLRALRLALEEQGGVG